jgi:hypothetical protein
VTLTGSGDTQAQLEAIGALVSAAPRRHFAVKDSFQALDLSVLGFAPLFDAEWIELDPAIALDSKGRGIAWSQVGDPAELIAWRAAWAMDNAADPAAIFRPALLQSRDHVLVVARRDGCIAGGCVLSRSPGVIGLSNIFVAQADAEAIHAGCLAFARRYERGLPVVGYESGARLALMKDLGCQRLGALRVWLRSGFAED